ncbi:MAG: transcriptional regulator, GntR family [Glaciihabitans sp.]|nr:transcriptional regulator, GntR family [Glaciihabitans sp.]
MSDDRHHSGNRAYESLREDILLGRYTPNQRLVEVELCELLGVSRTPVRQALLRLEYEGLVESRRRGWIVHEHTEDEVRKIYEVRSALEGYAARLAAMNATPEEIASLAAIYPEPIKQLVAGPRARLVELNGAFHRGINHAGHNERLASLCESNQAFAFNYHLAATYSDDEMSGSLSVHMQILAAVEAHDADLAERLGREHVTASLGFALRRIRHYA